MHQAYSGNADARGLRVAVLVSRYNDSITNKLRDGAREALITCGAQPTDIDEFNVPGAWELPPAAKALAETTRYHAIVCLGCVIRGDTTHHIHIGGESASGLARVQHQTGIPIGFGLLTVDSLEQALDRAGGKHGNKGAEAALSAVEMANLLGAIRKQ